MLPFYSAVRKEFSAICRLLGDGYPIRTSFYAGKNFSTLKPGKIYKSPGCGRVRHAIILIGAGRRGNINYYHLLNSWGRKFCLRILRKRIRVGKTRIWSLRRVRNTKKALGGFGLLRESDIVARPVTFLRHEDDRKYYESLLLEDIVPLGKTKEGPETASITPSWEAPQPSEGTSLMNSVLVSTESSGRGTQVAHAICSPGDEALVDCCNGYFASQISAPPPPNDMTVGQVADKLASFVAKNGRQFENITRQRNPGDTPFKFLFDKHSPDYKYYEFQLAEEEKALAQSKEAEASKSANSGIASFKAPAGKHRSSFEQKSNYQTPASALYGAYEGSSSHGSSSSYGDHMAPPSDPVALMEFYAKKAAQEEQKRTPRQSKDEMPPPPSLQGPPKKGHHMDDFILPEELENFMARCNDAAAQKATKEAAEKAKIQADNIGHKLLSKMGWREGSMLKEKNEQER